MLKEEILKLLQIKKPRYMSKEFLTENKVYLQLMFETKFLPITAGITERIYCIVNDIKKAPVCLCCGGELRPLHKFEDEKDVYLYRFCSSKCTRSYVVDMTTEHIDDNFSDIADIVKNNPLLIVKNRPDYVNKIKCHLNSIGVDYKQMTYPEAYHFINNGLKELPKCLNCGGKVNYNTNSKGGYHKFCSSSCNLKSDLTKEKRSNTNLVLHGCANVFQNSDIKEKIKKTNEIKYGGHPMTNSSVVEKQKQTMIKSTGYDNYFKQPRFIEDLSEKNLDSSYNAIVSGNRISGYTALFSRDEYVGVHKKYMFRHDECKTEFLYSIDDGRQPRCPKCFTKNTGEQELMDYLSNLNVSYEHGNRKLINPYEIDIYLPNEKIGIEYNGLYWHCDIYVDKNYHLNKTKMASNVGIKLIQIFEDEWNDKKRIVKNRIKHSLNKHRYVVGARKCKISVIDSNTKNKFLKKYHIQGIDKSSICLGAFYNGKIVGVMTFCNERIVNGCKSENEVYELCRFCTIGSLFSFPGLASKMLSFFKKKYSWKKIITYADLRWSNGDVYYKMGFQKLRESLPSYYYLDDYKHRYHRFNFRKSVLIEKLESFDENLSEHENMKNAGYKRIYDCGNLVFEMKNVL